MKSIVTSVSTIFNGNQKAYIYILVSKKWEAVYVGQTNDALGTLGRLSSHMQPNGAFRKNFENKIGIGLEKANDVMLLSFVLPSKSEFINAGSSYREAVEYLVQKELQIIRGNLDPSFKVISNVRYIDLASKSIVKKCARKIVNKFKEKYEYL
ncbi:GIY-YIG nuclease family protein [Halobacteroides halobius]|nr:GIY-YIG nuclease family protein [Halobacteroides halobius]